MYTSQSYRFLSYKCIITYLLNIKTVQSGAFRILIEALKEILTDGSFTFDESGIKLMAMDSTHSILKMTFCHFFI